MQKEEIPNIPHEYIVVRRTAFERLIESEPRTKLAEIVNKNSVYQVIEISRQEDIYKVHEMLKFLPDNPNVSYILAMLEVRDSE